MDAPPIKRHPPQYKTFASLFGCDTRRKCRRRETAGPWDITPLAASPHHPYEELGASTGFGVSTVTPYANREHPDQGCAAGYDLRSSSPEAGFSPASLIHTKLETSRPGQKGSRMEPSASREFIF